MFGRVVPMMAVGSPKRLTRQPGGDGRLVFGCATPTIVAGDPERLTVHGKDWGGKTVAFLLGAME